MDLVITFDTEDVLNPASGGMDLHQFDRQPRLGPSLGYAFTTVAESRMVVPNLNVDRLYRMAKLQSWTLARAWHA